MDKKISNTANIPTNKTQHPSTALYLRHGRTTAIDDHSDLQVLKRIKHEGRGPCRRRIRE